jgi:hypothetical protein
MIFNLSPAKGRRNQVTNIGIYGALQNYCVAVQLGFQRMTKKGFSGE